MTADVDPQLLDVFAPIARDLESAGLRAKLGPESRASKYFWQAALYVDGKLLGTVQVDPEATRDGQLWSVAWQVQDYVLEFVRHGSEAVVWPRCRSGHNHPMLVDPLPGSTFWVCPIETDYRVPIGQGQPRS